MTKAEDLDHTPLTFGKYEGKTPDEISHFDPGYIIWLARNVEPSPVSDLLARECRSLQDDADSQDDNQRWSR